MTSKLGTLLLGLFILAWAPASYAEEGYVYWKSEDGSIEAFTHNSDRNDNLTVGHGIKVFTNGDVEPLLKPRPRPDWEKSNERVYVYPEMKHGQKGLKVKAAVRSLIVREKDGTATRIDADNAESPHLLSPEEYQRIAKELAIPRTNDEKGEMSLGSEVAN